MEQFIKKYIHEFKELLRNGTETDIEELQYQAERLYDEYGRKLEKEWENGKQISLETLEEEDIVSGLNTKLERIHSFHNFNFNRDPVSKLAAALDILGCGFVRPKCKYEEDDFKDIQKDIITFIANRSKNNPERDCEEDLPVLVKGKPIIKVTQDQMMNLAQNLAEITKDFTAYIDEYRPYGWCWRTDLTVICQYLFEKMAELTYKKVKNLSLDDCYYDIREAFDYYEFDIPENLQNRIDGNVKLLERVLDDTFDFVEKKKYDTCDSEYWLRPILYNIGLDAIQFTLETEL